MIAKMQSINWDDLRFFLAVAERGSLSGASRQLGVNHSTVFRRITQFEHRISVRLFERLPDGYQLTSAGEQMLERAGRVRDEVDALALEVIGQDVQPSGVVRITAPDSLAYNFINRYLVSFLASYPLIDIELNVSNRGLDLSRRETDIAVRATPKPPPHLVGRKIFSIGWAFYATPAYLESRGVPESIDDLKDHEIVGPDGPVGRLEAYRWMAKIISSAYRVTGNDLSAIAALGSAGNGIVLLPDDQINTGMQRLFPPTPAITSDIWILTHPELRATERIRLLTGYLVDSFRNDPHLSGRTSS
jgi:DNA-binding transcriptional LysR family regulator